MSEKLKQYKTVSIMSPKLAEQFASHPSKLVSVYIANDVDTSINGLHAKIEMQLKQIHQCGAELNETTARLQTLRKAIAIYCREEVDIDFEYDDEAVGYFVAENNDE